jgi:hypothetical protein
VKGLAQHGRTQRTEFSPPFLVGDCSTCCPTAVCPRVALRSARVRRGRPGSDSKRRARVASDHYINHAVKPLPWHRLSAIGFEDLNGLKQGKCPSRGKNFGIAALPLRVSAARKDVMDLATRTFQRSSTSTLLRVLISFQRRDHSSRGASQRPERQLRCNRPGHPLIRPRSRR